MNTTPSTSKTTRRQKRSNPLASYLSLTVGAGAAATAFNAEGAVVTYNGATVTANVGEWLYFSPMTMTAGNGGGGTDQFKINYSSPNYVYTQINEASYKLYWGTQLNAGTNVPLKLSASATIDASTNWFGDNWAYFSQPGWTTAQSPWATRTDGTTGYIAFKFAAVGSPETAYYGWADFTYNNGATQNLVLNNFAYNNTANEGILAGAGAVPEPSTMALLALGGASTLLARRRRKAKQTAEVAA